MFYLEYILFCVGVSLLQSAHLRAPQGIVPTKTRILYGALAWLFTGVEILIGILLLNPTVLGATLWMAIFWLTNQGIMKINLRLRYTFRIGIIFTVLAMIPLVPYVRALFD